MRKINVIIILLTGILISCSENENPIVKTNLELLTEKKWAYSGFEFLSSSLNDNNYSNSEIEMKVDELYKNVSINFETNGKGLLESQNSNKPFTWELVNNNLKMIIPVSNQSTDDIFIYLITFNDNKLELKMTEEFVLFINENEMNALGIQYYE